MEQFVLISFMVLTTLSSLVTLLAKNILYAALSLFFTFLGVAGIYVLSSADFLAVTQLIVYVGGVLVLTLFGIMLTNRVNSIKELVSRSTNKLLGYLVGLSLFGAISFGIYQSEIDQGIDTSGKSVVNSIGMNLMTDYLLLFEIAGVLLLVVLVGAAYLVSGDKLKNE